MTTLQKISRLVKNNPGLGSAFVFVALDLYAKQITSIPDEKLQRNIGNLIDAAAWKTIAAAWLEMTDNK